MDIFRGLGSRLLSVTAMLKNINFFHGPNERNDYCLTSLCMNYVFMLAALCEVGTSIGKHCVSASCLLGYGSPAIIKWIIKKNDYFLGIGRVSLFIQRIGSVSAILVADGPDTLKEFFPFHGMERVFRKDHFVPRCTRYLGSCCFAVGPASAALAQQRNGICPRSPVFAGLPRLSGSMILGCLVSMARCRCSFGNAGHFCTGAGPSQIDPIENQLVSLVRY